MLKHTTPSPKRLKTDICDPTSLDPKTPESTKPVSTKDAFGRARSDVVGE